MSARLPKQLRYAVNFANACRNIGIDPHALADLIALSRAAACAGVRECNDPKATHAADRPRRRVERAAREAGLSVDWPGLFPSFTDKRGKTVHLPSD